jgi:hypothetical protein
LIPVGPQRLALRLDLPLLVGVLRPTSERGAGCFAHTFRYALHFEALELEREEAAATQQVAHVLSRNILYAPEHWLWMAPGREPPAQKGTRVESTRSKTVNTSSA